MRLVKFFLAFVFAWMFVFVPAQVSAETTTVILVRHGETFYNAQKRPQGFLDIALNENGLNQAKLLAKSLKNYPIDVVHRQPAQTRLRDDGDRGQNARQDDCLHRRAAQGN